MNRKKKQLKVNRKPDYISVFEHNHLKVGQKYNDVLFTEQHLQSFEKFYGDGIPYYTLISKGVRFNEYVGVIHMGKLVVEVLPKADKYEDKAEWQKILIGMLRTVNAFNIHAPSQSSLSTKTNFVLDLYFELFIKEVEYLFNKGLIKKYRKIENNSLALKGSILFGKHISRNLVHQERFYVRHSTYDKFHLLHQILYKTLQVLKVINTNAALSSRIGALLLRFPEMKDFKVSEPTFDKISYNRKIVEYKNAIEISRLLLLNYHPDLNNGQSDILALMFDMNLLWEKFIYVSLRKKLPKNISITSQISKQFWQSKTGYGSTIKPDIVLKKDNETFVLDTKWKNIENKNPSPEDLRQLYVYHEYFFAKKVALIYPGSKGISKGKYSKTDKTVDFEKECSIIQIKTNSTINIWQENIADQVCCKWLNQNCKKREN